LLRFQDSVNIIEIEVREEYNDERQIEKLRLGFIIMIYIGTMMTQNRKRYFQTQYEYE